MRIKTLSDPDSHNSKWVVTGGTGYLGSRIVEMLVNDDHRVLVIKRRTSVTTRLDHIADKFEFVNVEELDDHGLFNEPGVDTLIHCATNYGRNSLNSLEIIEANLLLPLRLLEMGRQQGLRRFINTDTILDPRVSYYALSKRQFRQWLEAYSSGLSCVNIAIEHFYGPGHNPTKFVTHIVQGLLRPEKSIALTPGEQRRQFVYIDDVVSAFRSILANTVCDKSGYKDFQIGSDDSYSIRQMVEMAREIAGNRETELAFGALPYREGEVMNPEIDLTTLKNIGWKSTVALHDGLQQTIEFETKAIGR